MRIINFYPNSEYLPSEALNYLSLLVEIVGDITPSIVKGYPLWIKSTEGVEYQFFRLDISILMYCAIGSKITYVIFNGDRNDYDQEFLEYMEKALIGYGHTVEWAV
jgi:hypothetical protein